MSLRNLLPSLLHAVPSSPLSTVPMRFSRVARYSSSAFGRSTANSGRSIALSIPRPSQGPGRMYTLGLGLAFSALSLSSMSLRKPVLCDTSLGGSGAGTYGSGIPHDDPPPGSMLNVYQLGFGTVAGICSGVFLKKGLRAIAFLLGGVFVLLQYMSSRSIVSVDWKKLAGNYDNTFGTKTADGGVRAPTVGGVYQWFVDFLTANFQQRASFLAGFVLGIRLG